MFRKISLILMMALIGVAIASIGTRAQAGNQPFATMEATMAATAETVAELCGQLSDLNKTAATAVPGAPSKGSIVFVPKSTDASYWLIIKKGAEDRAKTLGYTIDYQGVAKASDIAGQVDLVHNLITRKPAGILLAATDAKALAGTAEEAAKAGVPLVTVDAGVTGDAPLTYIATDNLGASRDAAKALAAMIGEKGKVADIGLDAGSQTGTEREKGFADEMKLHPGITVVPVQYTKGCDPATALNTATDILTANPDLVGIYAAGGPCGLGVAQAVKAKGLQGKVKIVTFDPSPDTVPLFEEGTIHGLVAQDPYQMGYCGVTAVDAAINKKAIPVKQVAIGVVVITKDNYKTPAVQKLLNP